VKATSLLGLAAALLLSVSATGCNLMLFKNMGDSGSRQLVHKSSKLTLAWDRPRSDIPNRPTEVTNYQIYFREHGTPYWSLLAEIPASAHPEYTVEHERLGNGVFDFAVRSIAKDGRVSTLHTSLDSTADPITGWYVMWAQSY
jgi:hypothetical protein